MTRLMIVIWHLLNSPKKGISEKESYFDCHILNARNEISEIERELNIKLNREREKSSAGRLFTRYTLKDEKQIFEVARLFNERLKINRTVLNRCHDVEPITAADINKAIRLLGN
ncbi:hypothetical protein ACUHGC_07630 [Testudinibacter sp. P27/CKL/0425]